MEDFALEVENLAVLRNHIPEIVRYLDGPIVVLLTGDLGAGKTTLVQEICTHLGVQDAVTSPTFALIQEYRTHVDEAVFHADLYRLDRAEELTEIGILEIFDSNQWVFVEWPAIAADVLPQRHCSIRMQSKGGQQRKIVISRH